MYPSDKVVVYRQARALYLYVWYCLSIILLLLFLLSLQGVTTRSASAEPAGMSTHTSPTVNRTCSRVGFSPDGNPFPLCPGPYPLTGGNCVWWAWEQWHLLGYNLPVNWGNPVDWVVDAEQAGLSVGKLPRVGSVAVFPRADGVWAFGPEGHVAFVTNVAADGQTFDVTYQNYGDPTPMYEGKNYNVSLINQADFQDGTMSFIYFPRPIDMQRFAHLPGIGAVGFQSLLHANTLLNGSESTGPTYTNARLALDLTPVSSDQEFDAQFTAAGPSNLLLYNRQAGRLSILRLQPHRVPGLTLRYLKRLPEEDPPPIMKDTAQMVNLRDARTPSGKWGAHLEIHIGRFAGNATSDILLYDRVQGTIQLLSLNDDLTIKRHVILSGYGSGWELYVGQFDGQRSGLFLYNRFSAPEHQSGSQRALTDLSGTALAAWERRGRSANIYVLDFNPDFSIRHQARYTLWHASWEVYVGRFGAGQQDGIFLFDRSVGEGRLMDFDQQMLIEHYQEMHNLNANWIVYSGDFMGSGRAQLLFYDPGSGQARIVILGSDLSVEEQKSYADWGPDKVLYVGHFGMAGLSVMLYEPSLSESTFLGFNRTLKVTKHYTVKSWDQNWQILIGSFLPQQVCQKNGHCATSDNILVLNRQTGQMEQYAFTFGRTFKIYDNRLQAFERVGIASKPRFTSVDTTVFKFVSSLEIEIKNEELY
jgi:hypothetical protein